MDGRLRRHTWDSPTATTWASLTARLVDAAVILPLVLRGFDPAEVTVWLLLISAGRLSLIAESGVSHTFTRLVAYAWALAHGSPARDDAAPPSDLPAAVRRLADVTASMTWIYRRVSVGVAVVVGLLGTLALSRPIEQLSRPSVGWQAWLVVVATIPIVIANNSQTSFLFGSGQMPLVRRWEAIISLVGSVATILALTAGLGLLGLVASRQASLVLGAWINLRLRRRSARGVDFGIPERGGVREVTRLAWPSIWRSTVGVSLTAGVLEASGFLLAHGVRAEQAAGYLVALRLLLSLQQFSYAPFSSALPDFIRLFARGQEPALLAAARKASGRVLGIFALGSATVGLGAPWIFHLIRSSVPPPPPLLWALLGCGLFWERYGAMHLQLYTITNDVVWHRITAISGSINVVAILLLLPSLSVYAFPLGLIAAQIGHYGWAGPVLAYRRFGMRFREFERASTFPALVMIGQLVIAAVWTFSGTPS